jgi:hypothetical protein
VGVDGGDRTASTATVRPKREEEEEKVDLFRRGRGEDCGVVSETTKLPLIA